jgi:predicted N-acetyltransferase YhbS
VQIRFEKEKDTPGVQRVNEAAFERAAEANLVAALREQARR